MLRYSGVRLTLLSWFMKSSRDPLLLTSPQANVCSSHVLTSHPFSSHWSGHWLTVRRLTNQQTAASVQQHHLKQNSRETGNCFYLHWDLFSACSISALDLQQVRPQGASVCSCEVSPHNQSSPRPQCVRICIITSAAGPQVRCRDVTSRSVLLVKVSSVFAHNTAWSTFTTSNQQNTRLEFKEIDLLDTPLQEFCLFHLISLHFLTIFIMEIFNDKQN